MNMENILALDSVDYATTVPAVYCSAKINLNISSFQLVTAVNQRVFDVPACGAFLLTDERQDAARLFTPDQDIVLYRDFDELRKKAEYYLSHDDERLTMAERGRTRVLREHTYAHRAGTIIDVLKRKKHIS